MLSKMKLFGKMKILEKVENENSVCFRKTGHKETKNMATVNHGKKQLFSVCVVLKKNCPPFSCKISAGALNILSG